MNLFTKEMRFDNKDNNNNNKAQNNYKFYSNNVHYNDNNNGCYYMVLFYSLLSLSLSMIIKLIECRLVSINPNYPLLEPTLSGPLLWPEPQRYLINKNHQPYRVRFPITDFNLFTNDNENNNNHKNKTNKIKKCDVIEYNINKYRHLINQMIKHDTNIMMNNNNNETCNHNDDNDERKFLQEIQIHIDHVDFDQCENNHPDFVNENNLNMNDESYEINIEANSNKALLKSKTIWGMIRSLETFSQLLYVDEQNCMIVIDVIQLWDRPRFRYRSIMIDTARHYLPIGIILQNLDAMAYNKLNILHWHLNDDQSFPFESDIFPNISRFASYSNRHVYQKKDIIQVIKQAKLRGIQVIFELNTPAHGHSLAKVFPEIMSGCNDNDDGGDNIDVETAVETEQNIRKIYSNILNPSNNSTYEILEKILLELKEIFPSNCIHLGMDDVSYECWTNDPQIRQFMGANRMHSFEKLEQYHLEKMINMVNKLKSRPIIWQDPFDKDISIPIDTIVQVWKDHRLLDDDPRDWKFHVQRLLRSNHTVILSSCYFLNIIQYGQDWKQIYDCDPHDFDGFDDKQKQKYVIGGEACIWGEYIDQTNFMSRTWPRASAMAERLWSHVNDNDYDFIQHRLHGQRCRMLGRGLPAQPISTGFCQNFDILSQSNDNNNDEIFFKNANNNDDFKEIKNDTKMVQEFLLMINHEKNLNNFTTNSMEAHHFINNRNNDSKHNHNIDNIHIILMIISVTIIIQMTVNNNNNE